VLAGPRPVSRRRAFIGAPFFVGVDWFACGDEIRWPAARFCHHKRGEEWRVFCATSRAAGRETSLLNKVARKRTCSQGSHA